MRDAEWEKLRHAVEGHGERGNRKAMIPMSADNLSEPFSESEAEIGWLLDGDPVIRWQVMRDLLDKPEIIWRQEQERVATEGWGAEILRRQAVDGSWPKGRWTDTIWTLLLLLDCGISKNIPRLCQVVSKKIATLLPTGGEADKSRLKNGLDLCHVGFWLRIGAAFAPANEPLGSLVDVILDLQLSDGGWNCRVRNYLNTKHSSFHTTFNVLEGLRGAVEAWLIGRSEFDKVESKAAEFMLAHRMFKSDKTGEVVNERMTELTFPSHWHYTVLRGLDYIRGTKAIEDPRLSDAIELLKDQRHANGRWHLDKRIPGTVLFDMEKPRGDSRWNTLRALRVLRRRGGRG